MYRPIAITGIGVLSPLGMTGEALWHGLAAQDDRRGKWSRRDVTHYPVDNAVSIPEEVWSKITAGQGGAANRARALASFAVARALDEAHLPSPSFARLGCILGSTTAGVEMIEESIVSPRGGETVMIPAALDGSSILSAPGYRWTGPTSVISTACSSGLVAPALAMDMLLTGEADAMVAGGVDVLLEYTICGFNALRLATDDRCRPFSTDRKGVVLSEGAVCLCLEPLGAALARGASVRAIVTGYGLACDADHVTAPNAAGIGRAISQALEMSELAPNEIGAIFAHGTGTVSNDASEVAALRSVFGDADLPPITSIKSVIGHSQAAAGAFSLLAAVLALEKSCLPATAGLSAVDPELGQLDVIDGEAMPFSKRHLMVNAFGFGGNNCVMIVSDPTIVLDRSREAA
jgi:3-oxoacyl-(acyl-carrier-protein) synthase